MANQANYARIGFAVVAGVAAIVATLVYLGGAGGGRDVVYVETYSDNPVSGLSVGSDVNFRGVKLGEVREISLIGAEYDDVDRSDALKIYILMKMDARKLRAGAGADEEPEEHLRTLVARGLHATVTSSGITGLSKIELNFPRGRVEKREISWHPRDVCIPPAPSMLESFSDAAEKIIRQIGSIDIAAAWTNISGIAECAGRAAANIDGFIAEERNGISGIVRRFDEALGSLNGLVGDLRENPSLLLRPRDPEALKETGR